MCRFRLSVNRSSDGVHYCFIHMLAIATKFISAAVSAFCSLVSLPNPVFGATDPVFGATDPVFGATDPVFGATDPVFGATDPVFGDLKEGGWTRRANLGDSSAILWRDFSSTELITVSN
jgi:hypothetical protein